MKTKKHILMIFSIALNIGFIVAAVFIYYNHPATSRSGYLTFAREIIKELDLPAELNEEIKTGLELFRKDIASTGSQLQQLQNKILKVLSASRKLNEDELSEIYAGQDVLFQQKHKIVRDHLLMMKSKLGDEKSSRFFSELLKKNKG